MRKIIVNTEYSFVTDKLTELGFEIIPVIRSERVSLPVSAHCDVLYNKVKSDHIIMSACQKANYDRLTQSGYKVSLYEGLKPGYKTECGLNFIANEKLLIHNPQTAVKTHVYAANEIYVRQGYTRCSILTVNEDAYITDDTGIYNALENCGFSCLLIKKGIVSIDGYNYGFIGGASINLCDGNILFCGDIDDADEKEKIISFAENQNCSCIFIGGYKLTDIGSRIIL